MSCNNNNSNSNNNSNNKLSDETKKMIEEKRRQTILLREQRAKERLDAFSQNNASPMTSIKPMINVSPNRAPQQRYPKQATNSHPYQRDGNVSNQSIQSTHTTQTTQSTQSTQQTNKKQDLTLSMRLISSKRFEVTIGYNEEVVTMLRKFASRVFDINSKKWSFDIKDYIQLMQELHCARSCNIIINETIPESVMIALNHANNQPKHQIDLNERLSDELVQHLFEFQKKGIIFGIQNEGRCLIADDMGLGKTIQAIAIAQWFRDDWPLIIVCPSSLRYQWFESVRKWVPNLSASDITIVNNMKQGFTQVAITIISYDLLMRMRGLFTNENIRYFNMVILDESHYIKCDKAQRTESVITLAKSCKRVVLLTGTPALSRPIELFPQISLIDPKLFSTKHNFGTRYCNARQQTFRGKTFWDYKGADHLDELGILLESTIMIRRLKKDVISQLPKKYREMIVISLDHLTEKEKKMFASYPSKVKSALKHDRQTCLFKWFNATAEAKLAPICQYLEEMIDKDIKFLCFCHHREMMDGISELLTKKKVNHIRIDGQTLPKYRQEACDEFQTKTSCKVGLLSITSSAVGLNLTAASTVIFAETYWNPGVLAQAEDRVHRIGQQNSVRIIYLVAKGTVDDMIWPLISKKLDVLNKVGLSKDSFKEAAYTVDNPDQQLITEFIDIMTDEAMDTNNAS